VEYIWLNEFVELKYKDYILLISVFKKVENLYIQSLQKNTFYNHIKDLNIAFDIYIKLTDYSLKSKAKVVYSNMNKQILIIPFKSKYYPKNLINIYNVPIVIYAYGNINLLNNKIIYVVKDLEDNIYNNFCYHMLKNNISIIDINKSKYNNVIFLSNIGLIKNCISREKLIISTKLLSDDINLYENITGICDALFIPNLKYNKQNQIIVDLILEQGKDIYVVPGEIYNKNTVYSNYLIKSGAYCITYINELLQYLQKK
jgi:DNA processing protein